MGLFYIQEQGWRKGPWTPEEDKLLSEYVNLHGEGRWSSVARCAGLNRNGKSCRLRWVNYLRPGLKRGQITVQEEGIIIELHALWGNKWSTIARYLPGRTDNEIKNFWRTHFKKKQKSSLKQQKRRSQILKEKLQKDQLQARQEKTDHTKATTASEEQINFHDDDDDHQSQYQTTTTTHDNHHVAFTDPSSDHTIVNGSHHLCLPVMYQDLVSCSWSDATPDQECLLWGGLWNLDDPCGVTDNTNQYYMSKLATTSQINDNNNQATGVNYHGGLGDNYYYSVKNTNNNINIIPIQNQARAFSSCEGCIF